MTIDMLLPFNQLQSYYKGSWNYFFTRFADRLSANTDRG